MAVEGECWPAVVPTLTHPLIPIVGCHVLYREAEHTRDALVHVVFSEHACPHVSLIVVRPGERGIKTFTMVPHITRMSPRDRGGWLWPEEVVR